MPLKDPKARSDYSKAYRAKNAERLKVIKAAYRALNKERLSAVEAVWRKNNVQRKKNNDNAWRARNKQRMADQMRAYRSAHREEVNRNSAKFRARNVAYYAERRNAARAALLQAMPHWANKFFIEEAYALAQLRTKITGFAWHVDHIVPLQSSRVCGLHVEHNLQVIPGRVNQSKSNRHWPDMP